MTPKKQVATTTEQTPTESLRIPNRFLLSTNLFPIFHSFMSSGKEGGDSPHPLSVTCELFTVCLLVYPAFYLALSALFFLSSNTALARPAARRPATRLATLSSVPVFGNLPSETEVTETAGV